MHDTPNITRSFSKRNFLIEGFSVSYRIDRDSKGTGTTLYVRQDIPSNLNASKDKPIEIHFTGQNLRNKKMLIVFIHS